MEVTRKDFIKLTIAGLGGLALGCPEPICHEDTSAQTITSNHASPHALTVPIADFNAGTEKTYNIQGQSTHPHEITLTAAHFTSLKKGESVTVTSTTVNSHAHDVTVTCAHMA